MTKNKEEAKKVLEGLKNELKNNLELKGNKAVKMNKTVQINGVVGFIFSPKDKTEAMLMRVEGCKFVEKGEGMFVPLNERQLEDYHQFVFVRNKELRSLCDELEESIYVNKGAATVFRITNFGNISFEEVRKEMVERGYAEIHGSENEVIFRDIHSVEGYIELFVSEMEAKTTTKVVQKVIQQPTKVGIMSKIKNFLGI